MNLLQLVDLLELGSMDQKTSYATPLKLLALGRVMGLEPGKMDSGLHRSFLRIKKSFAVLYLPIHYASIFRVVILSS